MADYTRRMEGMALAYQFKNASSFKTAQLIGDLDLLEVQSFWSSKAGVILV